MSTHLKHRETGCSQNPVSSCRFCQNYSQLKGQAGYCQKLNAPVVGKWKSCCLALPPFAPSWEN